MNFTQLQAYLKAYLETNDSAVIDQIPNFMTLALARISAELRGVVAEVAVDLLPEPVQPQPKGFMGAALLLHNGMVSEYVSPAAFTGLTNEPGAYYTLLAGQISVYPAPTSTTLMTLTYYQATGDNMSASLPHLLLHCAAAEAEMFQGNLQDAATEIQLYQNDMGSANGWDIQSGPITLGGGLRATQGAVGSANTPGAGYVKGPAGSTSGFIPLWDGTTGRLLAGGISPANFADTSYVDSQNAAQDAVIATKADKSYVDSQNSAQDAVIATKADKSYVDSQNAAQDAVIATKADASALGTAAAADLTTSSTDATAGRVLQVGAQKIQLGTDVAGTVSPALTGTPTAPTATVGTNTTQIATTAFVLANANGGIGVGQTWQTVTGSRANGTTYTNSSGKPIQVSIRSDVDDGYAQLTVGGIVVAMSGNTVGVGDNRNTVSAIVPNGAEYVYNGSAFSLWAELR